MKQKLSAFNGIGWKICLLRTLAGKLYEESNKLHYAFKTKIDIYNVA
jgi:hypothetical protein